MLQIIEEAARIQNQQILGATMVPLSEVKQHRCLVSCFFICRWPPGGHGCAGKLLLHQTSEC